MWMASLTLYVHPIEVSISKIRLNPKQMVAGLVGFHWNNRGLGMDELYIPLILFTSFLHRPPCFANAEGFAIFARDLVNYAILVGQVNCIRLRLHQVWPKCGVRMYECLAVVGSAKEAKEVPLHVTKKELSCGFNLCFLMKCHNLQLWVTTLWSWDRL